MKKLNIEFIRAEFAKEGYILLTEVYEGVHQKLKYICPRGHRHSITWANWNSKNKHRCPYCDGQGKPTIEHIRAEFAKEGYILLTETYENSVQKLEYICSGPEKHRHSISWGSWSNGTRCPYCVGKGKATIEHIRAEFAKEDYELLTTVYEGVHQKLEYICPRGHRHSTSWNSWKRGVRCPCFSNLMKPTIEYIRAEFVKEGYILLTKVYENAQQKLEYICPMGHHHSVTWGHWNSKRKDRCPFCNDGGVSKWEKTVKNFLAKSNIDYVSNDRTQLVNPNTGCNLELDVWFPQLNKAIECNGLYWHKDRQHIDLLKKQLCKDQGIDLLVITDKEWKDDTDKCKNKIQEFLC